MTCRETNSLLLEKARNGDANAENSLVEQNMGLVKSIALRFAGRGEETEDLIQLGLIGLVKAVRGYDPSFGTAFSTYAVPMIMGEIRRYLRDNGPLKVSRSVKQLGTKISFARSEYIMKYGSEPSLNTLSGILGCSVEDVSNAICACTPTVSLQDMAGDADDKSLTLEKLLSDTSHDKIGDLVESLSLESALMTLGDEEKKLIFLRYRKGLTQAKTGEVLGFTQVKVSRMESKILKKLKAALG